MVEGNRLEKLLKNRGEKTSDSLDEGQECKEKSKLTIMVVDDDSSMRRSLESIFNEYNVICAKDGKESIELFKKNSAIHCVLMDALMPQMDGFETSKCIHELNPGMPIIMLTAYQDEHNISKVVALGFEGYVTKGTVEFASDGDVIFPNVEDLKTKIKKACDKYSSLLSNRLLII